TWSSPLHHRVGGGIPTPGRQAGTPAGTGHKVYVLLPDQQLVKSGVPSAVVPAALAETKRTGRGGGLRSGNRARLPASGGSPRPRRSGQTPSPRPALGTCRAR